MDAESQRGSDKISTLNEGPLHAALKSWYARPGDRFEVRVEGFLVDILQGDLLVEIQTANFSSIKRKLARLAAHHRVRLVYPVAAEKWIVRLDPDGHTPLGRRKSPKRGAIEDVFQELVRLPELLLNPDFSIDVLLIQEEEVRSFDAKRAWRRKGWVTQERRLLDVVGHRLFETPQDLAALIPGDLAEPFSTAELAAGLGRPDWLARKMAYCLREMGVLTAVGKRGNAILYVRAPG